LTTRAPGADWKPDELLRERWDWSVVPAGREPTAALAGLGCSDAQVSEVLRPDGARRRPAAAAAGRACKPRRRPRPAPGRSRPRSRPPSNGDGSSVGSEGMEPYLVTIECVLCPRQHSTSAAGPARGRPDGARERRREDRSLGGATDRATGAGGPSDEPRRGRPVHIGGRGPWLRVALGALRSPEREGLVLAIGNPGGGRLYRLSSAGEEHFRRFGELLESILRQQAADGSTQDPDWPARAACHPAAGARAASPATRRAPPPRGRCPPTAGNCRDRPCRWPWPRPG
jgi:hypothetical protein